MTIEKTKAFNSKILLFGEYTLIVGSMALCIPYDKYNGQLLFDKENKNSRSNHYSVVYLLEYLSFLKSSGLKSLINLDNLKQDIEHGLIFETNIPISYGLGSSGAIVASIYNSYAIEHVSKLEELKRIFSKMESYYHGKSSGLDPLVSYLDKPIFISNDGTLDTVDMPKKRIKGNSGIFLIDTKTIGETQPLVTWFLDSYKNEFFKTKIHKSLIPYNNGCINSFVAGDFHSLVEEAKLISEFTLNNFPPMIPGSVSEIWKKGLMSDDYYLKLCGSGGGGMMIGFSIDIENTLNQLSDFSTQIVARY